MTNCDYCGLEVSEDGLKEAFVELHTWEGGEPSDPCIEVQVGDLCAGCYPLFRNHLANLRSLFKIHREERLRASGTLLDKSE